MFSIHRVVILSFVFAVLADSNKEQCRNYLNSDHLIDCCNETFPVSKIPMPDFSECDSKENSKCERDLCSAKIMGFTTDDGKLDRTKMVEVLFTKMTEDVNLMEDITSKCINGDVEMYAHLTVCDSKKLANCVAMQWLKRCPVWLEHPECQTFKDNVQKCVKMLA